MASGNLDPNNFVDQIRLLVGDYIEDEPFLNDSIYVWLYEQSGNSIVDAAIAALESIINNIALSPSEWRIGDASERQANIQSLTNRLNDLKSKKANYKIPVLVHSDRKTWVDFDKAFGCNY